LPLLKYQLSWIRNSPEELIDISPYPPEDARNLSFRNNDTSVRRQIPNTATLQYHQPAGCKTRNADWTQMSVSMRQHNIT